MRRASITDHGLKVLMRLAGALEAALEPFTVALDGPTMARAASMRVLETQSGRVRDARAPAAGSGRRAAR